MIQVNGRPPNFERILAVLPGASEPGVIFAYAPDIYAPGCKMLPAELVAHEAAHIARQVEDGVEAWWDRYLVDTQFRLDEEVIGHRAEYVALCQFAPDREARNRKLHRVALKLCAPLYGYRLTYADAKRLLLERT